MKAINKNVLLLAGVGLLLVTVVAAVSFRAFSQINEAGEARKHTFVVISNAQDLMSALIDAETGQRGYLLTGDKAFLEPYLAVRDGISGQLEKLRLLTSISAAHKHLDAMAPLIVAKLAELSHVIELHRNNDMTAALAVVSSGHGKQLMDSIRAEMSGFIQIEEGALAQHDAEFQSNMLRLFIIIVTTSLLMLLLALSFVYFTYREKQQQLKNLVHLETQHLLKIQEETNKQLQQANVTLQVSEEKLAVTLNSIGDAVMALPYLMEYPYECSEQIFNRLYANVLARHIANSDPKIRRIFDLWKNTPALDSPLEKNQDLKAVMLEEIAVFGGDEGQSFVACVGFGPIAGHAQTSVGERFSHTIPATITGSTIRIPPVRAVRSLKTAPGQNTLMKAVR